MREITRETIIKFRARAKNHWPATGLPLKKNHEKRAHRAGGRHEVSRRFMELFIDAYDWVMVPNVYGMSQFADGGVMSTKPYISGSNYPLKMSDYPKGEWQLTWDALFWRFMHVHRIFFNKNPRMSMLVKSFDKMPSDKKKGLLTRAESTLSGLDKRI